MLLFSIPTDYQTQAFIDAEKNKPYSYPEVGCTNTPEPVEGYNNDHNFVELGNGEPTWNAAKEAVRKWKMFPGDWAFITPADTPLRPGEVLAMTARVMGFWWLNSCRIVYIIDNERQFGFAYGTLPGHAECGEELFIVEKDDRGNVRYTLRAFSQPRHWMARLAYPVARAYQRKFVRDSKRSMQSFVTSVLGI